MQRGTITLTQEELNQLLSILDTASLGNTQLEVKLNSAKEKKDSDINILLSEDEIERILDQAGPPTYQNQITNSVIKKCTNYFLV